MGVKTEASGTVGPFQANDLPVCHPEERSDEGSAFSSAAPNCRSLTSFEMTSSKLPVREAISVRRRHGVALVDEDTDFSDSGGMDAVENFFDRCVFGASVGLNVDLILCAATEGFADFHG